MPTLQQAWRHWRFPALLPQEEAARERDAARFAEEARTRGPPKPKARVHVYLEVPRRGAFLDPHRAAHGVGLDTSAYELSELRV